MDERITKIQEALPDIEQDLIGNEQKEFAKKREVNVAMNQNQYRPDIDGLRAIAVISVLIHHLNASFLPGGFVGVDIFFVISGFLITSHIHKETSDKTFTLKQFYKRRINRIIPALVTVVVASFAVGAVILSPVDLVRLTKSSIYVILGISNIFFWQEYGNYFGGNASEAPLLHTWSLGVEEQFYAVWPLLILILIKLNRRGLIVGVFAILTIGAIAVSEIAIGIFTSASYYLIPSRFFELMIGGLLSLVIVYKRPLSRFYSGLSYISGFILIGCSLFFLNKQTISLPWHQRPMAMFGSSVIDLGRQHQTPPPFIANFDEPSDGLHRPNFLFALSVALAIDCISQLHEHCNSSLDWSFSGFFLNLACVVIMEIYRDSHATDWCYLVFLEGILMAIRCPFSSVSFCWSYNIPYERISETFRSARCRA